jgi:Pro-kumamolisin, activation domain
MRSWKFILPLLASSLCFAAQSDRITGPIDSSQVVPLAKSLHPKAQPQYDTGAVDPSLALSYITLLMAPSPTEQRALDQLLAQQQDRNSSNYHKWLTPGQFADRFGLSQNDINKVTAWLKSQGFEILSIGGGRNSVAFSGTASQVQSAFKTEIHNYNIDGQEHFANSMSLMIPAALNGVISSVMGLHSFLPKPASQFRGGGGVRNSRGDYYDGKFVFPNFLAPDDVATIYDIAPLYGASTPIDGTGQKLAIVGQTDVYLADINDFRSGFNLAPITGCTTNANGVITACSSTYFQYNLVGSDPGTTYACGDLGEADLDIEWSGATARKAQIVYVNSPVTYDSNCNPTSTNSVGVNAALSAAINPPSGPPVAPVISMSYGICELQAQNLESLLEQGNAEGVTILNSSGDQGSAGCDFSPPNANLPFSPAVGGLAVSYPASSPEVTAVGGTEISLANDSYPSPSTFWSTTLGPNGATAQSYIPELPWNDDEEFAQYCHSPASGDTFCKTGGTPAMPGWVPLTASATAAQVQSDIWISAGGGGASNCVYESANNVCLGAGAGPSSGGGFAQPSYQQGLKVPNAPAGVRYVPDVSLLTSPNFPGYIVCTPIDAPTNTASTCASGIATAVGTNQSIVGGTSVSSPVFAGIVALLNQALGGSGQGNINPKLYALAATPTNGVFHSIASGDNNVYCQPNTPTGFPSNVICPTAGVFGFSSSNADPTTGYNLVTGLGSVDADKLVLALAAPDFQFSAGTLTPSPVPAGQSATATLTITAIAGSTGMVVNFSPSSCAGLPTGATCSFNPASVNFDGTNPATTVLTISTLANMTVPSAPQTITIAPINSSQTTTTVSLSVAATTEKFTIAPTSGSATFSVAAGTTVPVSITVTSQTGFVNTASSTTALPLNYTCSGLPTQSQCAFSPSQSTSATSLTVNITTVGPTGSLRPPLGRGSRIFYALLLPGMFGLALAGGSRTRAARLLGLIVVLGFSALSLSSCGSSSSQKNSGTTPGTYAVTVTATTGGANPLTNSFTVSLTITQ